MDPEQHEFLTANFRHIGARVVEHDEISDVAILQVDSIQNPFKSRMVQERPLVVKLETRPPSTDVVTTLFGYPLSRPELLSQNGNVSGAGFVTEPPPDTPRPNLEKISRIFVSVVSNPGNSGGPVVNSSGELIGLLEGNLTAPVRDAKGRKVIAPVVKLDEAGKPVLDDKGKPQFDLIPLNENSGISIVVPSFFVKALVVEAKASSH